MSPITLQLIRRHRTPLGALVGLLSVMLPQSALAAESEPSGVVRVLVLTTVLTFIPALLLSVTCFTRILVVFAFLKQGLGTPHVPPAPVLVTLALALTAFASMPMLQQIHVQAVEPWQAGQIDSVEAMRRLEQPLRVQLAPRVVERDVALFAGLRGDAGYASVDVVPMSVLIPAFMLGELRLSFRMGFSLLVPFLVIDLLVATILMTLGMMMLPPILVSLPIKLLVFVSVDGWALLVESLARGVL
ncbi:MAG: flagellar type III secretion system pore protein FliP [Pseudomonadota bacterium]